MYIYISRLSVIHCTVFPYHADSFHSQPRNSFSKLSLFFLQQANYGEPSAALQISTPGIAFKYKFKTHASLKIIVSFHFHEDLKFSILYDHGLLIYQFRNLQ